VPEDFRLKPSIADSGPISTAQKQKRAMKPGMALARSQELSRALCKKMREYSRTFLHKTSW